MITPLVILGILVVPLALAYAFGRKGRQSFLRAGGFVGLSMAFVFFGIGHFVQTAAMAEMLPPWVPYRFPIIYLTGVLEWVLAIGLLIARFRRATGWACIAVLIAFFPANVYAAVNSVGMGGHLWGPVYLLIRAPLQLVLIGWSYWFAAKSSKE